MRVCVYGVCVSVFVCASIECPCALFVCALVYCRELVLIPPL